MLAAIAFLLAAAAPASMPSARARLLVRVRLEGVSRIDDRQLRTIAAGVREIWRPYLDVVVGGAGDLRRTVEDDELELVITDRVAPGADGSLGWIEFVDGQPARTITVSSTAAQRLAARGSWGGKRLDDWPRLLREQFVSRALARSIAHEIGHYLLRSKVHTTDGLMRERFTVDEIMEVGAARYRLARSELQKLQLRLKEYADAQPRDTRPPA